MRRQQSQIITAVDPTWAVLERCVCAPGVFGRGCEQDLRRCLPLSTAFLSFWQTFHITPVKDIAVEQVNNEFPLCGHGGSCVQRLGRATCECADPWRKLEKDEIVPPEWNSLIRDERAIDRCVLSKCVHKSAFSPFSDPTTECNGHGKCIYFEHATEWRCVCDLEFYGKQCEIIKNLKVL